MKKIIWKKPLAILIGIILAWAILPNAAFWGLLIVALIFWFLSIIFNKKVEKGVKVVNATTPKETRSERERANKRTTPGDRDHKTDKGTQADGPKGKHEGRGDVQAGPGKRDKLDKRKPKGTVKAAKPNSIAIPNVEPVEE